MWFARGQCTTLRAMEIIEAKSTKRHSKVSHVGMTINCGCSRQWLCTCYIKPDVSRKSCSKFQDWRDLVLRLKS